MADGLGCPVSPDPRGTCLLVRVAGDACSILGVGSREDLRAHPEAALAEEMDLSGHVVLPGLVNAHCHLDLTAIGPQPRASGTAFPEWLDGVRRARLTVQDGVAEAVRAGVRASVLGGVVAVGDIAGSGRSDPLSVLRDSPLEGVSFLELFGLGGRQAGAIERADREAREVGGERSQRVRRGLSPHAPYSAGPDLLRHCAQLAATRSVPVCTHLAESMEEREWLCSGTGRMREFFRGLGIVDAEAEAHFGGHASPVQMALPWLSGAPWVLAHVNDCSDEDIRALASTTCSVVYCPRASWYFEHHKEFGPHRYRAMVAAGINVALGTDSILSLPADTERLSTLDEMRFLHRRDEADPWVLLRMATVHGARALGLKPEGFVLRPARGGTVAGLVAVPVEATTRDKPPMVRVLESDEPPVLLWPSGPGEGCAHAPSRMLAP